MTGSAGYSRWTLHVSRSRVSGEGGTEEGVDGKRVSAKTVADIYCLSEASIRGLVRKGEIERAGAPHRAGGFGQRAVLTAICSTFARST